MSRNGENSNGASTRLTLEQILESLTLIAQTGSGSERIKALSLLAKQESGPGPITLPEPMGDAEVVQRLGRLIRTAGPLLGRLALEEAFPGRGVSVPAQPGAELPREAQERVERVKDLGSLYEHYPMLKLARGGRPHGFPAKSGPLEKKQWAQGRARAVEIEQFALASAPRGQASVESLLAAVSDLRALISVAGQAPHLRGSREVIESVCAAVDALLAGSPYPALPAPPAEPAQRLLA